MPDAEIDSSGGANGSILQLKVRLLDVSPMVWRRVLVPAAMTLKDNRLAQHLQIGWFGHQRREPRQGRLRRQAAAVCERRQTRRGTGRQPERRVVAQAVRIVMIAPALRDQQYAGADQRGEVMRDVLLAARVVQAGGHPAHDPTALEDLPQHHRTGVAGQTTGPAFNPKLPVVFV